jgi:hypothetical protein
MTGRIWSAVVATGLALALSVLVTSTAPTAEFSAEAAAPPVELTTPPLRPEADVAPWSSQVVVRADRVERIAKFRASLAVVALAAPLGLAGALAVRRSPDTCQPVPSRVRRHVIVSRGPPAFVA